MKSSQFELWRIFACLFWASAGLAFARLAVSGADLGYVILSCPCFGAAIGTPFRKGRWGAFLATALILTTVGFIALRSTPKSTLP